MENGTRNGRGFTLWFTGLSGAGKTTIAEIVEHELRMRTRKIEVLDGDIVRTNLSKGLGFSREDRNINVLRIGFVANLLTRAGVAVIVSAISPYKEARDQVRRRIVDFVEVFVVPIPWHSRQKKACSKNRGVSPISSSPNSSKMCWAS